MSLARSPALDRGDFASSGGGPVRSPVSQYPNPSGPYFGSARVGFPWRVLRRAKRCNAATGSQPFLQTVLRKEHARSSMCVDDLRRARAMRCMACGEEMRLTRVVRDETCERHTLHCLGCEEVERPLVLLAPRHDAGAKDNNADQKFAPSSAKANAQWDREFSQLWDEPFPRQRLS